MSIMSFLTESRATVGMWILKLYLSLGHFTSVYEPKRQSGTINRHVIPSVSGLHRSFESPASHSHPPRRGQITRLSRMRKDVRDFERPEAAHAHSLQH